MKVTLPTDNITQPMNIERMEPMEVDPQEIELDGSINPFNQDSYNMGTKIGTNVTVMFDTHENQKCDYLIVVNTITGERVRITF